MKNVIILYGGESVESEISLQSAQGIIKNIDQTKFFATMQDIKDFDVRSINKEALIFIAVHGKDGEDGATQKLLSRIILSLQVQMKLNKEMLGQNFFKNLDG